MAVPLLIPIGSLFGHFYEKWAAGRSNAEFAQRMGVLLATGLIVGESLFGVIFAGIVAATNKDTPLAVLENFGGAVPPRLVAVTVAVLRLYARTPQQAAPTPAPAPPAGTSQTTPGGGSHSGAP